MTKELTKDVNELTKLAYDYFLECWTELGYYSLFVNKLYNDYKLGFSLFYTYGGDKFNDKWLEILRKYNNGDNYEDYKKIKTIKEQVWRKFWAKAWHSAQ